MRRQRYQPGIQNGPVAKRRGGSRNTATSKSFASVKSSSRRQPYHASYRPRRRDEGRGAGVMWMMIMVGMALAAGFVFALRSQINAHQIAKAEETLKMKLDEYASQQKFLSLEQQRALSAGESDRAGRLNGLNQLRLDTEPPRIQSIGSIGSIGSTGSIGSIGQLPPPLKAPQTGQSDRSAQPGPNKLRPIKQPVKTNLAKTAKVVKVVKSKAAKRARSQARVVNAPIARVKYNQRQTSRSQPK
jgi:hypothetical protein